MLLLLVFALAQFYVAIGTIGKVRDDNFLVPKHTIWMAGTTGASSPFNGGGHRNHLKHRMITHTHLIKWVGDEDKTGSRLLGRLTRLHPQAPLEFVQGSSAPEPHVTITTHLHPFASTMNVKSASAATDPPTDACSAEFDAANQCLSTYSTSSCVDCMNSVLEGLPDGGMTCTFFKEQICAGISMCGCTACQDELEESSSCIVSYACGLLDCTGSDQPTNTEPTDDCSSELDLASQCVSSMSSGEACAGCFNSVLEGLPDVIPCLSFESEMCSAIDTCGCTACKDELLDLLSCQAVNCDPLDCLEEPTEPVVCASEGEISGECISGIASSSICVNCLNSAADAIGDSFSCVEYTTGMCPAIATECDCGSCRLLIQDFYSCLLVESSDGQCPPLNCLSDPSSPPDTTAPPTTKKPDTVPPTTPEPSICEEENSAVRACTATMNSCSACISAAYDAMFEGKDSISCAEFIVGMCPAIATECDCGDCRQSLEDLYSCVIQEGSDGECEPLDCNLQAESDEIPIPSSSCEDALLGVQECTATMSSCAQCIAAAEATTFKYSQSCEEYASGMCSAITSDCDCGECRNKLEYYYSCYIREASGLDCGPIDCPSTAQTEEGSSARTTDWLWAFCIAVGATWV